MGPSAGVVFASSEKHKLQWRDFMSDLADQWLGDNFCWVTNSRKFGGGYVGEARPFSGQVATVRPDKYSGASRQQLAAIAQVTGLHPTHVVEVGAMCKGAEDHRLLCEIVRALAEHMKGLVDFNGVITTRAVDGLFTVTWSETDDFPDDLSEYSTQLGTPAACDWWMAQTGFRMVK